MRIIECKFEQVKYDAADICCKDMEDALSTEDIVIRNGTLILQPRGRYRFIDSVGIIKFCPFCGKHVCDAGKYCYECRNEARIVAIGR